MFKVKTKISGRTGKYDTKDVKTMRTFRISLINCETNLILTWSANCFIKDDPVNNQVPTFELTDTKLYVPVEILSTQDSAELLQQLKSGVKRTANWKKYQSKTTMQEQNQYLDYFIDPSFQEVNTLFVLSFENTTGRTSYKQYCFLKFERIQLVKKMIKQLAIY